MKTLNNVREYINVDKADNLPLFYNYCKAAGLVTPKDIEYHNFEYFEATNYIGCDPGTFKIDGKQGYFTDCVCVDGRAVVFFYYTGDDSSEAAALTMLRDFFERPRVFDHSAALQNWNAWRTMYRGVIFRRGGNCLYYQYKSRQAAAVRLLTIYNNYEVRPVKPATIYRRIWWDGWKWRLTGCAHDYIY